MCVSVYVRVQGREDCISLVSVMLAEMQRTNERMNKSGYGRNWRDRRTYREKRPTAIVM